MDRLCKALLVAAFLAMIFIPAAGWLAGWHFDAGIEEKREPAPWPTMNDVKRDAAGAAKKVEDAFADRFAFRNLLIKADAWLNWKLFGISTTENVVVGRDGWLFFTGDRSMPLYQGIDRLSDADSAYVADVFEMRYRWLRDRGITSANIIAPAKESVYPEFMPRGIPRVSKQSSMEKFLKFAQGREGHPADLLLPIRSAKAAGHPLYLRGDSHWNDAGALVAYRQILAQLGLGRRGLSDTTLQSHVDPQTHPYHDLATMLGIADTYCRQWPNDSPVIAPRSGWSFETKEDPARHLRMTTSKSPLIDQPVLMFGDSFSEALLPFMAQTFASVSLYQGLFFSPAKVLEHKPRIVVIEGAERLVFHHRPSAAEEARVVASPAWEKRFAAVAVRSQSIFDSSKVGWKSVAAKSKSETTTGGELRLQMHDKRAVLSVPLAIGDVAADAMIAVKLTLDTPGAGVLKWQFENARTHAVAPSWSVHVELLKGANTVAFGLPAKGGAPIDHLTLSIQSDAGDEVGVRQMIVVAMPASN